jgi:preflagellin peptidase FlaK
MDPVQLSEYISVLISLVALTLASISDIRTREVSDKLWVTYGPMGLALTVYRVWAEPQSLLFAGISIGISIMLALALVFFGLSGGADAKALICLGLALPLPPAIMSPILGFVHPFFPLVVFVTTYIASLSVAVWVLGKNIFLLSKQRSGIFRGFEREPMWKKALALVTGFPAELSVLRSTFYLYPMEKIVEDKDGARRTFQTYSNADVDREQVLSEFFDALKKVGSPNTVWATPGLPLLVFMLLGLVIGLTVGDPLFVGIHLLAAR